MDVNTLKTSIGFVWTLCRKLLPARFADTSIDSIYNYLPISQNLATSGQPTEAQLQSIAASGYKHIINLAPHNAENALDDEAAVVGVLGLDYIHIPVDFKRPTDADFNQFKTALDSTSNDKVWVHCAANMRVSAFIYRYRREVLNEDATAAQLDLYKIWRPFGVWQEFLNEALG